MSGNSYNPLSLLLVPLGSLSIGFEYILQISSISSLGLSIHILLDRVFHQQNKCLDFVNIFRGFFPPSNMIIE